MNPKGCPGKLHLDETGLNRLGKQALGFSLFGIGPF